VEQCGACQYLTGLKMLHFVLEVEHSGATSPFIFYEPGTGAGCNM